MRKLKLQVQMTADGFVCGPNGELDWMTWAWDDKLKEYAGALTDTSDTILLGRKMAGGFINHWTNVTKDKSHPEYAAARQFVDYPKVVFTKTLTQSDPIAIGWSNTVLAKGDIAEEVKRLKSQSGKDIIVYGGATLNASLFSAGLMDDLHLFVNPVVIGKGMSMFKNVNAKTDLKLVKASPFSCGIVVMHYQPK